MSFDVIFQKILKAEGAYSNDPDDAGAETVYGISRVNYPQWEGWKQIDLMKSRGEDMDCLDDNSILMGAVRLFYLGLWNKFGMESIPQELQGIVFGGAINQGPGRVLKWLQVCLQELHQLIEADGNIGPATVLALRKVEIPLLYDKLWKKRAQAYLITANKPGQSKFMVGWLNRLEGGL